MVYCPSHLQAYSDWYLMDTTLLAFGLQKQRGEIFKDGDSIWVKNEPEVMRHFVDSILPNLNGSYILLTGWSDNFAPIDGFSELLSSPRLIRWFAQNPGIVHPKLEPMPLGIKKSMTTKSIQ